MHAEMLDHVSKRWKTMLDRDATTWWETFSGDHLDSFCHPWSSVPAHIALSEILGIKPGSPGFATARVKPLTHLIRSASGTVTTPRGSIHVSWENHGEPRVSVEGDITLRR
jgi:alpha-L-rhamnosidase